MNSVLKEIKKLRGDKPIVIDYTNSNRYRVVVKEGNGTKTAYYFSAPIYNNKTRKVVDMKFGKKDGAFYSVGSNANMTYTNHVRMENRNGFCNISLGKPVSYITDQELSCGKDRIYPTTNGFMYKATCHGETSVSFHLEVGKPFMQTRSNNKYFSLMKGKFNPFITVSCIGTADVNGQIIAPAKMRYEKLSDRKYCLTVSSCSPMGKWILFEANLYEPKLIQDTTVESANPKTNNVFGSSAFIGHTKQYGEQWLYSRFDSQAFGELTDRRILKAMLHLPRYAHTNVEINAFQVVARFCSFGANWNNKNGASREVVSSVANGCYQDIEITSFLVGKTGRFVHNEGIILKPQRKDSEFSVIATGDSYYAPQICEINFR